ncbi:DUF2460 domain-containing protein [Sphingobium sufflavum]|uniref:DUF2460 domain-containing protein n=1 Tax=Sphingobium sufflavum TaxID=1129547 RepID=UPI001F1D1A89|nr:DUF2460 domain-containing protein [Sphingobium sufflavum]MCE7798644.1 DUF2460 domain-containing protein [Sphingobium sufflavum]
MPYWLARDRAGQEAAPCKRFAAPYWTVDFPRPMMASVVTTGPDALRVDAVFYGSGELAGLIWASEDRWDHPLLGYETRRDYAHCRLRFRWRSGGVKPLDALHGPTLTIEGRDAAGVARAWYVRLWNYASGTPEDALIDLDFDALDGGYLLPGEADRVWPHDIDRMFLSIVPEAYDALGTAFAGGVEGWAELSDIRSDGSGSMLTIGDIMVPEHGLSMATGYDDAYHLTPERVLRQILALGYRGAINHYVGMSHYFRLEPTSGGLYASLTGGALNGPCAAWHRDFAARAEALGYGLILSLSYELFDAHCWNDWKQRAADGSPALTGWTPPSTLLSPAHGGAMAYLQAVAVAFVGIVQAAGLAVRFQVGEPWWWVTADGHPCLYDDAARAALGGAPPVIATVRGTLTGEQKALLDAAGAVLAASTAALCSAVRAAAADAETLLLVFLPSVLDVDAPEIRRANAPVGWAAPAFDTLQVEDYDWVTDGRIALSRAGRTAITQRLGYPREAQQYLSGFVLNGGDDPAMPGKWRRIAEAAAVSRAGGDAATFIWALPQVARDGFLWFDPGEDVTVQAFDDVAFPIAIGRKASVSPGFSTQTVESVSGREQRSSDWADARMRFDAGPGVRSEADLAMLIAFFRARRGAARGFRFTDPYDHHSAGWGEAISAIDQRIGMGDGMETRFPLVKHYGEAADPQVRRITRPVAGSVRIALDGVAATGGWALDGLGEVLFDAPPGVDVVVTAGFAFDVPVRFEEDSLDVHAETHAAGEVASVPLVEIRE